MAVFCQVGRPLLASLIVSSFLSPLFSGQAPPVRTATDPGPSQRVARRDRPADRTRFACLQYRADGRFSPHQQHRSLKSILFPHRTRVSRRSWEHSGSSRSTTSFATSSPLDDIGFAPAISDFCARARSLRGTPWQRPDVFRAATTPNVRRGRR